MLIKLHNTIVNVFSSRTPATILTISILFLLFLGVVDFLTGEYSLIVFYLIPVSFPAWFVSKRSGLLFCLIAVLVRLVANEAPSSFSLQSASIHYWNEGIELVFLLIMSLLFSAFRKNLDSEKILASTDPLTGILNRRSFFNLAEYELNRSRRYSLPFTIAYIDLDNFKDINDTFGHHVGDNLLVEVTRILDKSIRRTDILARFGGDEFVLMLPETVSAAATSLLHKIHTSLQQEMDENKWPVTFSIGVVTYLELPATVDEVVRRADLQMYAVKHSGKNRLLHTEISERA